MTTKFLTRDDILKADDRETKVLDVPKWGGQLTIRALSGTERDQYESSMVTFVADGKGGMKVGAMNTGNMRARLVSLSAVDADGNRMFRDSDVLALGDKSADTLNFVFEEARILSGLSETDVEALSAGLKVAPNGTSGSDSPVTSDTTP